MFLRAVGKTYAYNIDPYDRLCYNIAGYVIILEPKMPKVAKTQVFLRVPGNKYAYLVPDLRQSSTHIQMVEGPRENICIFTSRSKPK